MLNIHIIRCKTVFLKSISLPVRFFLSALLLKVGFRPRQRIKINLYHILYNSEDYWLNIAWFTCVFFGHFARKKDPEDAREFCCNRRSQRIKFCYYLYCIVFPNSSTALSWCFQTTSILHLKLKNSAPIDHSVTNNFSKTCQGNNYFYCLQLLDVIYIAFYLTCLQHGI